MTDEIDDLRPDSAEPDPEAAAGATLESGPAMADAYRAETEMEAADGTLHESHAAEPEGDGPEKDEPDGDGPGEAEPAASLKPHPPGKLERLQKILAQAGVASRRRAEELIEQGRVQVNGKVVTELGSKADASRDHIRVDGKLLQGAERLRYFVLNKPRGFVTTVKDPEGRPTVMQFFEKMRERLYPVGRLDYLSEGLLLVTNDGELANRLTKAGSGVEKTYLVKVSGQPSETELDILRGGVAIDRGKPGAGQVRTAAARIRQVRQGDNPWYEVVLIEGRNRELRKMFEGIGHFVEKIRRVGYGPLVLDLEPGHRRELEPEELDALRKAAEGKLRTPKSKEIRRRNLADAAQLPTVAPRPSRPPRATRPFEGRPAAGADSARSGPGKAGTGRSFPAKPAWKKRGSTEGPPYKRPPAPAPSQDFAAKKPFPLHIEAVQPPDRSSHAGSGRSSRPFRSEEKGLPRSFTSSTGKPRAGGARPSSRPGKPYKPAGRTYGAGPKSGSGSEPRPGSGSRPGASPKRPFEGRPGGYNRPSAGPAKRPFRADKGEGSFAPRPNRTATGAGPRPSRPYAPRPEGTAESRPRGPKSFAGPSAGRGAAKSGSGWKPKPSFGGKSKPGGQSRPPSKSGPRGAGGKKSGPRPGGKRSGPPRGKRS